jgi:hypothetical protein
MRGRLQLGLTAEATAAAMRADLKNIAIIGGWVVVGLAVQTRSLLRLCVGGPLPNSVYAYTAAGCRT